MVVHGERLFVLSAEEPLRADVEFSAEAVETLIGVLRTHFHYIIADVPRIPSAYHWRALNIADIRVIVADQTLRSVRDTVRLRTALDEGNAGHRNLLVVNRSGEGGRQAPTLEEMARRGGFTEAVAALANEISGRMPQRNAWWRFARS
jgi:Flp pilus assembly CpaE family ATPase